MTIFNGNVQGRFSIGAFLILVFCFLSPLHSQNARIYEETRTMVTYPFSEPDPVPAMSRIYPYFRFDGYTGEGVEQSWKMVVMENDYIKVFITPEIGGKIWGAIEKSTGGEFLYFNEVVKFRDIAMRGPWTSGGLEYNFGDIGHIPTAATPVDYLTRENEDGSVSCIVGAIDLPSRTKWNVAVNLYPDKAYVETVVHWQNATDLPTRYYHWMNAAAKAGGNLEFIYPGSAYIGHGGEVGSFPVENERNISFYEENNFGSYKSYHVLNAYSNFFGGYWHEDDFGFGHLSPYDDKPGKKIWIWGLSDQGMIWEDLLTDDDGQYIEYQSGKLFNQAAEASARTPFKHREFPPHDSDHMIDRWFPLKETGGMAAASEYGVLNTIRKGDQLEVRFSPLQKIEERLTVWTEKEQLLDTVLQLEPLELFTAGISIPENEDFQVELGDKLLSYDSETKDAPLDRPLLPNLEFDWESAYGRFTLGLEHEKQRQYGDAHRLYLECLKKEPAFAPALNRLALSHYRRMEYEQAKAVIAKSLAVDTYDPEANYLFGLIHEQLGDYVNAISGYGIATQDPAYRSPAYTALARLHLKEKDYREAQRLCKEALSYNTRNVEALEMQALIHRIGKEPGQARSTLSALERLDATSIFLAFERDLWNKTNSLSSLIVNELPHESYLELAMRYRRYHRPEEAEKVLAMIPDQPVALLWRADLDPENSADLLTEALAKSPEMAFPHRRETLHLLEKLIEERAHWKLNYYAALIYWNKGRSEEARKHFAACGNQPDFAPFYLARASLFEADEAIRRTSIERAVELAPNNWRANLAYAGLLFEDEKYEETVRITTPFLNEAPSFGMLYAKSLIKNGSPAEAVRFLEGYEVLPFEGAREGRQVYYEACIRAALQAFEKEAYESVVAYAKKARLWPRNLGVGKPYEVDERMEHYILAKAYEKTGDRQQQTAHRDWVVEYDTGNAGASPNLLFQALLLKAENRAEKAAMLIEAALQENPGNPDLEWVEKAFSSSDFSLPKEGGQELQLIREVLRSISP